MQISLVVGVITFYASRQRISTVIAMRLVELCVIRVVLDGLSSIL